MPDPAPSAERSAAPLRVLYAYGRPSRFIDIDREALVAAGHSVVDLPGRPSPRAVVESFRADAVIAWFAGWHAIIPVTVAWLRRRPAVVITGGVDVANVPEAGYGMQRGGIRKLVSSWVLRRATRLMANSESGGREARLVAPRVPVDVVLHGVPDLAPGADLEAGRAGALTVGVIDRPNLGRKGLRLFVEAAALLPDVAFVLAGRSDDPAAEAELRGIGSPNVSFPGRVSEAELARLYATSAVYVQASRHEGFGMAVAEAMAAGCIPVVTAAGSLPEVVGDAGVVVDSFSAAAVADGISRALALGPDARRSARERVLAEFTLEQRAAGLLATLAAAAAERGG